MNTQPNSQTNHGSIGLDTLEIDTIGEILNISMGAAATAISLMLNRQVTITTPAVRVVAADEFEFKRFEPAVGIEIEYIEGLHGSNVMIMSVKDADAMVGLLLGGSEEGMSEEELEELRRSALGEIMNQMMGASSTALATFLSRNINISPPTSFAMEGSSDRFNWIQAQEYIVVVAFRLVVENLLDSEFVTVMSMDFTKDLVRNAMSMGDDTPARPLPILNGKDSPSQITGHAQVPPPISQADYQAAQAAKPQPRPQPAPPRPAPKPQKSVDVQMLQFANLDEDEAEGADKVNLDLVMDIDLNLVVEIGRVKKLVKEILALRQGSVVELDRQAGEPVDILINGKLIAKGDVVVVDDSFGVRITEIVGGMPKFQ
jgi:flagellar motor switch protein FliN/FliY